MKQTLEKLHIDIHAVAVVHCRCNYFVSICLKKVLPETTSERQAWRLIETFLIQYSKFIQAQNDFVGIGRFNCGHLDKWTHI